MKACILGETKDYKDQADFIVYLQRSGAYQTYLARITEGISFVLKEKFHYLGEINRANKDYHVSVNI